MSRGFFVGAGWGTVVAGLGLVVASQLTVSPQGGTSPQAVAVAVANAPEATDAPSLVVQDGGVSVAGAGVEAKADSAAPQDAVPELSADAPAADAAPNVPEAMGTETIAAAADSLPASLAETEPMASAEIKRDSAVIPEVQTATAVPESGTIAGTPPNVPATGDDVAAKVAQAVNPLPDTIAPDAAPAAAEGVIDAGPEGAADSVILDPASLPEVVVVVPDAPQADGGAVAEVPSTVAAVQEPAVLRPATGFGNKVDGVKTGRLPVIGAAASTTAEPSAAPAAGNVAGGADLPPVERYARAFENADKKPLFAIVLQDTGGPDIDREALAAIPFPVSFMIDPLLPDAATAAQIYRAAGQEVLMIASGIPAGAQASDLAVSFEAMAKALPEAVAVVDLEQGGFQGNRTLATQVLALVKDQGRGVLSWDRGLNAASQVARREGIPSALIFRALDAGNEGSPIIRRYLDRAAFKAAQDGRVVVAGQTRPETVAALLEWAVEGRAATVALAPATAVMTAQ